MKNSGTDAAQEVPEAEPGGDSVRAVSRALDVLLAFEDEAPGMTATRLASKVGLSRPTLYRLLRTLESKGFVESFGEPQKFRLGASIAHLAHLRGGGPGLLEVAEPFMKKVWDASGETVALFVPEGAMRVCLREMPSANPLSFRRGEGYRERLVLGASGRSILAYLGDEVDLEALIAKSPVTVADFERELADIRTRGYAVSRNELIMGAVAIAAPIFGLRGRVAGSLGIFGPSVRLGKDQENKLGRFLISQAAALSAALGGAGQRA